MNTSGDRNGHLALGVRGEAGRDAITPTRRDGHERESLKLLLQAVRNHWPIPREIVERAPRELAAVLDDPDSPRRDRLRAIEVLAALQRDNVNAALALDKIERLDDGSATEAITLTLMPPRTQRELPAE